MHLHLRLTFSVVFLFGLSRESIDMQLNTSALSTVVLHYQQQRTVRYSAVLNKINISCTQFKLSHLCTFARLCLLLRTDILLKGTRAATIHTKERERERERAPQQICFREREEYKYVALCNSSSPPQGAIRPSFLLGCAQASRLCV